MKIPCRRLLPLLLTALLLPGCSMLTKSGRQQAAYAHYVSKMSKGRVKQQRLFHSRKPSMPVAEPVETKEPTISSGPQAVAENVP